MNQLPEEEKRKWIVKEESETNPDFGKNPMETSVEERINNGLVLIDKPYGPTSHQVSAWVRDLFGLNKAGHAGTLDPHVTGCLPIALERGTKILQALKFASKEYVTIMELKSKVPDEKIMKIGKQFVGSLEQMPPKMAAVKRRKRFREIYYFELLEVKDNLVLFKIGCEKGFYVRVFCEQFGKALNASGKMAGLRRTQTGLVKEEELVYLQDLRDEFEFFKAGKKNKLDKILHPIEKGVEHLRQIIVKDTAIPSICHGASLGVNGISKLHDGIKDGELVAALSLKGELVSLGTAKMSSEEILKKKGMAVKTERVFMNRNVYPKL